eukprot:m.16080 g.16080  ORF g.16080 m.16080 type:complete len:538 (+) comp3351_c0_seq1:221-1834(+)
MATQKAIMVLGACTSLAIVHATPLGRFDDGTPTHPRPRASCDVTEAIFGAVGDGQTVDTEAVRLALVQCDEVIIPWGATVLSGPVNLTSNQVFRVDGTFLATDDKSAYPLVLPVMGFGWGNDENCFPPGYAPHKVVVGSYRYSPVIGAYHATNVTITGAGVIDGNGESWWENCTLCHYPPGNNSAFCEIASRPKLIEAQFVDGFHVLGTLPQSKPTHFRNSSSHTGHGDASRPDRRSAAPASPPTPFLPPTPPPAPWPKTLTLQNSPFWTVTPSYTQNIHVSNLRILAPMDRIGNTDGVNLDSCRNALVENVWIQNSDDGVCIKSGLDGFGLNLAVPTENVLVRNITCPQGGRGGFAIGSEMSGGLRNVTYRDSVLEGQRGINLKPSVGRGGYIMDLTFENIHTASVNFGMGSDGVPLMPNNNYVPLIANVHFKNITGLHSCNVGGACPHANQSQCFNLTVSDCGSHCNVPSSAADPAPPSRYSCKRTAKTMFGLVNLPWPVCIPQNAPVNLRPDYPNWGPVTGDYATLDACKAACI